VVCGKRQVRRQRRALSLRRDTWARYARLDGIGPAHEARNTFAAMALVMEYYNSFNPAVDSFPNVSVFVFAKIQFTGRLSQSGDAMTFNVQDFSFALNPKEVSFLNAVRFRLQ
jgi:hypothetical protein